MPKKSGRPSRRRRAEQRKIHREVQRELARLTPGSITHTHEQKLLAAYGHATALKKEIADWVESSPYEWSHELFPKESMTVYFAELVEPPFARFASLAGDSLHNARAALDHLIYEIAEKNLGKPLPEEVAQGSEFPISGPKTLSGHATKHKIGALPQEAQDVILSLQPSQLGKEYGKHKLWLLHDLERIDKHRQPLVAAPVFTEMSLSVPASAGIRDRPGGRAHYQVQFNVDATFDGRTEMARFPTAGFDAEHVPSLEIGLLVLLDEAFPAGGNPITFVVDELFEFVLTDVVKPLRRFL